MENHQLGGMGHLWTVHRGRKTAHLHSLLAHRSYLMQLLLDVCSQDAEKCVSGGQKDLLQFGKSSISQVKQHYVLISLICRLNCILMNILTLL